MKKIALLIAAIIVTFGVHNTATAAQKCVAIDTSGQSICTGISVYNGLDWAVTCDHNGKSTPVRGIAVCASPETTDGWSNGVPPVSDSLAVSTSATANMYCWCKITYPFVSKWVFESSRDGADECFELCSALCIYDMTGTDSRSQAVRNKLFSNIES